ncbi:reverse transcriptase, RNA-dependent DNA polymerase [Tanacetum coccineum]
MGATATSVGVAVRTLMIVLSCLMIYALVYVITIDALASFFDFSARWTIALLTDISVNFVVIGYQNHFFNSLENKGSFRYLLATCGYILIQFHKLSPEEFSKDPLYFVLVRHQNRDVAQQKHGASVVTARVIFCGLGCLMLGVLIYTIVIDLSPSHDKSFGT